MRRCVGIALALLAAAGAATGTAPRNSERLDEPVAGLIVKFRPQARAAALQATTVRTLAARTGLRIAKARTLASEATVYTVHEPLTLARARAAAALLRQDPAVEYAVPDRFVTLRATVDPLWFVQWHYHNAAVEPGGISLEPALAITRGAPEVVVAVLDTGMRMQHPDRPQWLLPGYDFISAFPVLRTWYGVAPEWFAADGDGRDPDPTDPGDYLTEQELAALPASFVNDYKLVRTSSSWHGTHVTGTIAARTDNATGVAGVAPNVSVLPLRVLGKGWRGPTSDIIDAMLWAVGRPVSGVPDNPTPARILNLSLGGPGLCDAAFQDAVDTVTAAGAIVVAAAGNDASDVGYPANCAGVLAVTAHTLNGDLASYANTGAEVALSAPGGGCPIGSYDFTNRICSGRYSAVMSTVNLGITTPTTDDYGAMAGTSMATPHVAGVAALVWSLAPRLPAAEVKSILQSSARPHPAGTYCAGAGRGRCGAGMLDAQAALVRVLAGGPSVQVPVTRMVAPGAEVTLEGAASAANGRQVTRWQWRQTSGAGDLLGAADTTAPSLRFIAPATGTYGFTLTVTDSVGYVGMATTSVRVNSAPVLQPLANQTGRVGQTLTLQAVATDADGDTVSYVAVTLPAGASFDAATGRLTWTPAAAGTATFTVKATDGVADSAPQSATLTVDAPSLGSGGGAGGGGALSWLTLAAVAGAALWRRSERLRAPGHGG